MVNPYGIKRLPYPINRRTLLEQDDTAVFVSGNPENSDDCSWYVVQLSNSDRLKFTSALLAGLDLIYPDEFVSLFQLWLQPTEFPNTFPPNAIGCDTVDLCQLIIQCINDTPELQQLIATTSLGSSVGNDTPVNEDIAGTNVLIENVGCDNDNLFGMTTGIVDLYNNLAQDIIEKMNAAANAAARLGDAIEAVPGIGILPVDDALQFTESFLEDISNNYDSSYTVALRDEYRCDLFCIAKDECSLTFEQIFDYFNSRLITSIVTIDWQDFAEYFTEGTFSGEELVHAFHAFVAGVFMFGGDILGISSAQLINMVSALFNDPDPDWSILCDCTLPCELPITIDFEDETAGVCGTIDDGTIVASPAIGSFSLAKTTTSEFSDPTLDISISDSGLRNVSATWWHYFTPLSSRDVTIQIRAFNAASEQIGIDTDTIFTVTATWTEVTMQLLGLAEDISFIQVKSSLASGVTPLTVAIDDIVVSDAT